MSAPWWDNDISRTVQRVTEEDLSEMFRNLSLNGGISLGFPCFALTFMTHEEFVLNIFLTIQESNRPLQFHWPKRNRKNAWFITGMWIC